MPTALMLTLRPLAPALVAASLGRATHAAILGQVARGDAAFATRLHAEKGMKPLTVSNVLGLEARKGRALVSPASTYGLRVTLLCEHLEVLARDWTAEKFGTLTLDGGLWQVERVTSDAAVHPWAGSESYEALIAEMLGQLGAAPRRWKLEFVSPLTFRQGRSNKPLPVPELVFGSLFDRWDALAPVPLPTELRAVAAELLVSNFTLRSTMAQTKDGGLQIGTLGSCTYTAAHLEQTWLAGIDLLARFAFYSGIGAGTARGFGQARLVSREYVGRGTSALVSSGMGTTG